MADGNNIISLRTNRETAWRAGLRVVEDHPQTNAYGFAPLNDIDHEPRPNFEIDQSAACVVWVLTGLRLRQPDDFRQLGNLFLTNGWPRNFNALNDAELAMSAPPPEAA